MKTTSAPKKSIRSMPRPTEKRMGELRERVKETAEMERLEGLIDGGTESKAIAQDLKAAREDNKTSKKSGIIVRADGGRNPGANLKPIVNKAGGGMVKGYRNGGCVMAGRGTEFRGSM